MQFSIIVYSLFSCMFSLFSCKPPWCSVFLGHWFSFKVLYALTYFPYIAILYFCNCISYTENMKIMWPFLMKAATSYKASQSLSESVTVVHSSCRLHFWSCLAPSVQALPLHLLCAVANGAVLLSVEALQRALPFYFRLGFWCWNNEDIWR